MSDKALTKSSPVVLPYAWVILVVVYLASVVAPFNQFKVPPIMPVLMDTFQINLTQAGALMSIIAVTGLALALPAGVILQRVGPRTSGLIALVFMGIGAAAGALSTDYGVLMGSRVIEGIGIGLIGVVAPATIAMWFPPARQGTPMGIWATWVPVGTVIMYVLAPRLATSLGWQSAWWVGAGFALLMIVLYGLLVRRPPALPGSDPAQDRSPDLRKALANRDIWLISLEFACFNLVFVAFGTYYPTFLNEVRGYPLGQAALIASIGTAVVLVSAPLAGWLSDRIGSRRLVLSLPFLAIAILLALPFQVTGGLIIAAMVALGIFSGAVPTATFAAAPGVMRKPEWAGLGLAVVLVGQNLGQLIGPLLFGQLANGLGWATAGYLLVPVCLLGFVAGWLVKIQ